LDFRLPETKEVKAYFVKLSDGRIVARTEEEIKEIEKQEKSKKGGK
jgi:hypothetical protein